MPVTKDNQLGIYLRDRRAKLDPAALGFPMTRRRTPGLRREEVAERAHVSATWYTWLEQGRGGSPSADVLDRIARALMLTTFEREHLFLIALGRPPQVRYQAKEGIGHLQSGLTERCESDSGTHQIPVQDKPVPLILLTVGGMQRWYQPPS
jgi:transcriptional regulator with XRE-family HTH domain